MMALIDERYKYSALTSKVIECTMIAHSTLGNGLQVIYRRALEIKLKSNSIRFEREFEMPIFYRQEQIGTRRVDFLIENVVSVELKAITQ